MCIFSYVITISSGRANWKDAEVQCSASHHSCTKVSVAQIQDSAVHQEICYNCYGEACKSTSGCGKPWCFTNSFESEVEKLGCLYSASRGTSSKFKWNTSARNCASAHIACKFGYQTYMGWNYCKLCVSRCKAAQCIENWCESNVEFCENRLSQVEEEEEVEDD